jgi:hypothetical protein
LSVSGDSGENTFGRKQRGKNSNMKDGNGGSDGKETPLQSVGDIIRAEYERGYGQYGDKFAIGDCKFPLDPT